MARGAAKQEALGHLHGVLTRVFQKTLDKYLAQMAVLDKFSNSDEEEFADEFLAAALAEMSEPSPAMLSAITKFLKDNEIAFDDEDVNKLSKTEEALNKRRAARSNVVQLTSLKAMGDE